MIVDSKYSQSLPQSWPQPGPQVGLAPGEISVWKFVPANLFRYAAQLEKLLSPHERQRLERFTDEAVRREFVICRSVLHFLLALLSGEKLSELQIREDASGKPRLEPDGHAHPLEFNIAHTDGLCLIACARESALGVDVERVRPLPELDAMARKYLAPREKAQWESAPEVERTALFYRFWSAKEALLKALGSGLRIPPAQVDTLDVLEGKTLNGRQEDGYYFEINACLLEALPLEGTYSAWLAAFDAPERISLYELTDQWLEETIFFMGRNVEK